MGKNLAATLMSGEKPGEKMGPIVLSPTDEEEEGDGGTLFAREDGKDRKRQRRVKMLG